MLRTRFDSRRLTAALLIAAAFSACTKVKELEPPPGSVFDKQAMLTNMSDNVILPAYNALQLSLDSLASAFANYSVSSQLQDFQTVKARYRSACKRYQHISPYEFGPAESAVVRMNFNVFPTDTAQIKNNISSGSYDLATVSNLDAKGFPALDYLFFGGSETRLAQEFSASASRKKYVADLIAEMRSRLATVLSGWNTGYRAAFISSLGTDVGSSIGFLVNQVNFELDYLKNSKIGIPLGKKTLGVPIPQNTEALYSGYSVEFAIETLNAIENMYRGRSLSGTDGSGFDDYLAHLNSQHVNGPLHEAISAQFVSARSALAAIPSPLSAQVTSNPAPVEKAHTELLKLLVLLKTDMPSSLGVVITYQDGDGD